MREELLEAISQQLFDIKLKEGEIKVIKGISTSARRLGYDSSKELYQAQIALDRLKKKYNQLTIQLTENNFKIK